MAFFTQTFTIVNNSRFTLYLDKHGSNNLGDGKWPTSVAPKSTAPSFQQTGTFSVNPTAVYSLQGSNPPINAYLHFYCAGIDPLVHVNMTLQFSPPPLFVGSSIFETNSHSKQTRTADNNTTSLLDITTVDNGSWTGSATFTIGTN